MMARELPGKAEGRGAAEAAGAPRAGPGARRLSLHRIRERVGLLASSSQELREVGPAAGTVSPRAGQSQAAWGPCPWWWWGGQLSSSRGAVPACVRACVRDRAGASATSVPFFLPQSSRQRMGGVGGHHWASPRGPSSPTPSAPMQLPREEPHVAAASSTLPSSHGRGQDAALLPREEPQSEGGFPR